MELASEEAAAASFPTSDVDWELERASKEAAAAVFPVLRLERASEEAATAVLGLVFDRERAFEEAVSADRSPRLELTPCEVAAAADPERTPEGVVAAGFLSCSRLAMELA